ncbi:MAG: site-specific integrase [Phycisphaerae bacterium]|nr:site-specific integrase [Phycisphaerae bacterium]
MTRSSDLTPSLSDCDAERLLDATRRAEAWILVDRHGKVRFRITGPERRLLYVLAIEHGLRLSDLRSLRTTSFNFDADVATVSVAKRSGTRVLVECRPLRTTTAITLVEYLRPLEPGARAFRLPPKSMIDAALRADLAAVGLCLGADDNAEVGFSSLVRAFERRRAECACWPLFPPQCVSSDSVD